MRKHQQMVADKLRVAELMTTSLIALPPVIGAAALVAALAAHRHHSFPVTPDTDKARAWNRLLAQLSSEQPMLGQNCLVL